MIDYQDLRRLIIDVLTTEPRNALDNEFMRKVAALAAKRNLIPTPEECERRRIDYYPYSKGDLNPLDEMAVREIFWDFVVDRVLTPGHDINSPDWPHVRLTELGRSALTGTVTPYDSDGYVKTLQSFAPNVDDVILQYVLEGLNCFRQRLLFAAAVMFGAAAEKAILLALQSIRDSAKDPQLKARCTQLLDRPRLPEIFTIVQNTVEVLAKAGTIPYAVTQGATQHLVSLFEMIRVQRNDAVHPIAGRVNKLKVLLTVQSLPAAIGSVYNLIGWFSSNTF